MKRLIRLAAVSAATLVFGSLLALGAPAANAACFGGTSFTGATTGSLANDAESDWWRTRAEGVNTLFLEATDPDIHMYVWTDDCTGIYCPRVCTLSYTGELSIQVHAGTGSYALFAVPTTRTGLEPPPTGSCNVLDAAGVCVNLATDEVIQSATVYSVALGTAGTHSVVGSIQQWRFPLPTGGSVVLPCVVLTANGLGNSGCSAGGGTYVGTVATLVDQDVAQPSVGLGPPLLTVGICEARVTVTAAGFGVENLPLVSIC